MVEAALSRVVLSWSSGKDAAWCLARLREMPDVEVVALICALELETQRVTTHGVERGWVEQQARLTGIPVWFVDLPWPCPNEEYERRMGEVWSRCVADGITAVVFGDLFLADIRAYRESLLAPYALKCWFPAWNIPTSELALRMIDEGFKAVIAAVDPTKLGPEFVGRRFDRAFLADLPAGIDHCGENGEFHTFVTSGPCFIQPGVTIRL